MCKIQDYLTDIFKKCALLASKQSASDGQGLYTCGFAPET
jgi:hypothetical protein